VGTIKAYNVGIKYVYEFFILYRKNWNRGGAAPCLFPCLGLGTNQLSFLIKKMLKKKDSCPTRVTPFSLSLKLAYRGPTFLKAFLGFASSPVGRATPFLNALSDFIE
jgi:hypothetical protein